MKRCKVYSIILEFLLCITLLCGCSGKTGEKSGYEGHIAVRVEEETLASPGESDPGWEIRSQVLARQFDKGETVLVCMERHEDGSEICLYREGGEKEVLVEDASQEYRGPWHLGESGVYYITAGKEVIILSGEEVRRWEMEMPITDLCELKDGRVMLLLENRDKGMEVAELDPGTGGVTKWGELKLDKSPNQSISAGEDGLLLMDKDGVWKVRNLKAGEEAESRECVMPFGSTYGPGGNVGDFRMLKDGTVEVLQKEGVLQHLELYAPEHVVVARACYVNEWMRECASGFNQNNGVYYVLFEDNGDSDVDSGVFRQMTAMGIATGTGGDIIFSDAVEDVGELIGSGAFENLMPYIEASGIREEDYFPIAFGTWRDGSRLYGVNVAVRMRNLWMTEEFLGGRKPCIEALVEAMREYCGEPAAMGDGWDGQFILECFLGGSEDLWGSIDWETGACDFGGELFAGILWAAKEYSSVRGEDVPILAGGVGDIDNPYLYGAILDSLAEEGKLLVGFPFDDGCHVSVQTSNSKVMAISSTSSNKEGAWAFICYMLSEEAQMSYFTGMSGCQGYPVSRGAFDRYAELAIEQGAIVTPPGGGKYYRAGGREVYRVLGEEAYRALYDPTEERMAVLKVQLEGVKAWPVRTASILDIIYEEAGAYFSGDKELDQVVKIIENRVQLYLDEHY